MCLPPDWSKGARRTLRRALGSSQDTGIGNMEECGLETKKQAKDRKEVQEFTGEEISEEGIEEQGVKFQFCMYERE